MKRGGTFCKFTIGKPGTSAVHLRYIARERAGEAGRIRSKGSLSLRLPEFLMWETETKWFLREVVRWAGAEEREELRRYHGHGSPRTHYRAILSFEKDIGNIRALSLVKNWLDTVLPDSRACAFLHRDTAHLHCHVWIAARQVNGRKINLPACAYRRLDEQWNRLYSQALGRDTLEHLAKKEQTRVYKQRRRAGQVLARPERAEHCWIPALFNERERQRLGGKVVAYDAEESRTHRHQPPASRDDCSLETAEPGTPDKEPTIGGETEALERTVEDSKQAVSEAQHLHQDAQRVAEQEREHILPLEPKELERE